jgi:hypothetical protein
MDHKKCTKETAKAIKRSHVIEALELTALVVAGAAWQHKQHPSHILYECVALVKFTFRRLG